MITKFEIEFFSFFGKAFEQVAEKTGCMVKADFFDSTGEFDSV